MNDQFTYSTLVDFEKLQVGQNYLSQQHWTSDYKYRGESRIYGLSFLCEVLPTYGIEQIHEHASLVVFFHPDHLLHNVFTSRTDRQKHVVRGFGVRHEELLSKHLKKLKAKHINNE